MAASGRRELRLLRIVPLAPFLAFEVGFVIGTQIRKRLEAPIHYHG